MSQLDRQALYFQWFNRLIAVTIIAVSSLLIYWTVEPDPLSVVPVEHQWSLCKDRKFSFSRMVVSSKAIDIHVQQRWHNIDGIDNYNGIEFETTITKTDYYPLGKDFKKVMQFNKCVPDNIPVGRYEYRPWATYQVNPIKTIYKLLPVQYVNVVCDFDPSKHKGCN